MMTEDVEGAESSAPERSPWTGRSAEDWAKEIGVPELELHPILTSTNARLRERAREGAPPFATVVAEEQSAGRGREGRSWHSFRDAGLWISILVPLDPDDGPPPTTMGVGVLPLAVGIAVAHTVERVSGATASVKWPNDVLVGSRKVAGVLCESAGDPGTLAAVGIGVNLRMPAGGVPPDISSSAGFLEDLSGRAVSEPELARILVEELRRWAHPVPRTLSGDLSAEWESRDHLRGRLVQVESGMMGVARGVSPDGALLVELAQGSTLSVRAGSVRAVGPGPAR